MMKKIALLFTLTLCTGALNGMEPERGRYIGMEELPVDVKGLIIQSLASGDTLSEVLNNIKAISRTNKQLNTIVNVMYGNPKVFTALVHTLANEFNTTTEAVAKKIGTPAAKHYLDLADQLNAAISYFNLDEAIQLIKQGADVNYPAELVIQILSNSKDRDDVIKAFEEASKTNHALYKMIYEENGDPQGSNALVQALYYRFIHPRDIWITWDTPGLKRSISLAYNLEEAIRLNKVSEVEKLIKQGANVYFNFGSKTWQQGSITYENVTPFDLAAIFGYTEIAKLLLDAGALIHPNDYYATHGYVHSGSTLAESGSSSTPNNTYAAWESWKQQTEEELEKEQEDREKIRIMIDEAMKEQSSVTK